jgi:hypothetical protein
MGCKWGVEGGKLAKKSNRLIGLMVHEGRDANHAANLISIINGISTDM